MLVSVELPTVCFSQVRVVVGWGLQRWSVVETRAMSKARWGAVRGSLSLSHLGGAMGWQEPSSFPSPAPETTQF